MLGERALIWGSDVPFAGGGIESLAGSPDAMRDRILGANALDTFLRLGAEVPAQVDPGDLSKVLVAATL